jgi:hypothetical protein
MPVKLGPMTASLTAFVRRWVDEDARADAAVGGRRLPGDPMRVTVLDANGDVWQRPVWADALTRVEDGPEKVLAIALGTRRLPELAAWLPSPPANIIECSYRGGRGWFPAVDSCPGCSYCSGLGW